MSPGLLEDFKSFALPVLTALGTWFGLRISGRKNKTDAAQALFNEVQEERAELKKDNGELRAKVERLEADMRAAYGRELIRDDFIQDLRNHIRLGLGPPPPDWPEGLRHG